MKLSEMPLLPPKILLWGTPGAGKTALVLTYGEGLTYLDFDRKLAVGTFLQDNFTKQRGQVEILGFYDKDAKKPKAFAKYRAYINKLVNGFQRGEEGLPEIICTDSLTIAIECAFNMIVAMQKNPTVYDGRKVWNEVFNEIKALMLNLFSLPIPVIMVAHDMLKEAGEGMPDQVRISIPGRNFPAQILARFDETWKLQSRKIAGQKDKRQYYIQTIKTSGTPDIQTGRSLENNLDTSCGLREILNKLNWRAS